MEIAKQIAGFSPAEADDLRKAIGKKIHALMASLKDKFIEGCIANSTSDQVARQLWDDLEKSQDYSFNKSHAACYALIAYQTAWLRANHPCEYMAALISSVMNTKDRVPFYVNACHELGIEVLPPDVNESQIDFAVVGGKIRFGLNAVKGVGEIDLPRDHRARARKAARSSRSGTSPSASTRRSRTGASSRRSSSAARCRARAAGCSRCSTRRCSGARSSRPTGSPARARSSISPTPAARPRSRSARSTIRRSRREEFDRGELLRLEKEVLGLYVSEHPLSAMRDQLRRKTDATLGELDRRRDGEVVTVGGIVGSVQQMTTKRGDLMVFLRLEDVTGGCDVVVFNSTYAAGARAVRRRPDPDRQGPDRPQGRRDEARRARAAAVRGGRREARGPAEDRRHRDAGWHHSRATRADPRLPGGVAGLRRLRHVERAEDTGVRPGVQGAARTRLLRRGQDAARGVGSRVA